MSRDRFTGSRIDTQELRQRISDGEAQYFSPEPQQDLQIELEMRADFAEIEQRYLAKVMPQSRLMDYQDPDWSNLKGWVPDHHGDMIDRTRSAKQRDGRSWGEVRKRAVMQVARKRADGVERNGHGESWSVKAAKRQDASHMRQLLEHYPLLAYITLRASIPNGHEASEERQRVLKHDSTAIIRPSHNRIKFITRVPAPPRV